MIRSNVDSLVECFGNTRYLMICCELKLKVIPESRVDEDRVSHAVAIVLMLLGLFQVAAEAVGFPPQAG